MYFLISEEDIFGSYSSLLARYYVAEGVMCGHNLLVASAAQPPATMLQVRGEKLSEGFLFGRCET